MGELEQRHCDDSRVVAWRGQSVAREWCDRCTNPGGETAGACGAHRRRSQREETWREMCGVMRDESRVLRLKVEDLER